MSKPAVVQLGLTFDDLTFILSVLSVHAAQLGDCQMDDIAWRLIGAWSALDEVESRNNLGHTLELGGRICSVLTEHYTGTES
jgi:hypothetical protein